MNIPRVNWISNFIIFIYLHQLIIKVKFILSSICNGLEFRSVNHESINKNSELNVFKIINYDGEVSSSCPNDLFGINVKSTPKFGLYV